MLASPRPMRESSLRSSERGLKYVNDSLDELNIRSLRSSERGLKFEYCSS